MTFLEEIEISEGDHLDRSTLDLLLNSCTNLRSEKERHTYVKVFFCS